MSSISFPHSFGQHSVSSSTNEDTASVYSMPFEPSTSSFQMNPLSSHPPRTPRVSVISNAPSHRSSKAFTQSAYGDDDDDEAKAEDQHEVESVDSEEDVARKARRRVRHETIWKEVLSTTAGRDKAFKLLQYSIRVYLLFHTTLAASAVLRKPSGRPWNVELVQRLESTAAGFSLTRKCLILFNWLHPLHSIREQHYNSSEDLFVSNSKKSASKPLVHTILHAPPPVLLGLLNAVADDVSTFSKLGLLGKRTGTRAGKIADWCWWASTMVNLVENFVERSIILGQQHEVESRLYTESMTGATATSIPASKLDDRELRRLQKKDYWLKLARMKLLMDLTFVSYDCFKLKKGKRTVQAFSGLTAAVLSTMTMYNRHKQTLVTSSNGSS